VDDEMSAYRQHLVLAEQKAQEDFDKTVLYLSSGALGISFAFVDKFVKPGVLADPGLLIGAWVAWAASVTVVLLSFFLSRLALRKAIVQTDSGSIRNFSPGGWVATAVDVCNVVGALLFVAGLALVVSFVRRNMGV